MKNGAGEIQTDVFIYRFLLPQGRGKEVENVLVIIVTVLVPVMV